jgi:hypothetical protein
MTLPKQTSLFTEDRSTYSQVDSHVSPTPQQESDLEKRMIDISGRKCVEQYGRFNRHGLWARTFSDLLIGMEGWYSTRCKLTWKLKGTKYNRMYFQLYPSTLPIGETEYGLLPTPTTQEPTSQCEITETRRRKTTDGKDSHSLNLGRMMSMGMLPTPKAWDGGGGGARPVNNGKTTFGSPGVKDLAYMGMLPTPTANEYKDSNNTPETLSKIDKGGRVLRWMATNNQLTPGERSQLNPRFVLEMMGFPPDWTELPFLNGETNQ